MKRIAFLFPGQGSQYVGMGKELIEEFSVAQEVFAEANEVLGYDLQKLCFEGDMDVLTQTANTQPAILTHSVAALRVLEDQLDLTPKYLAGHSLGEYSALVAAGGLKFSDAVRLVHLRGKYMQEAVPVGLGSMMAIMKLDDMVIQNVCNEVSTPDEIVVPANFNTFGQVVISGHAKAVERAGSRLTELGASVKALKVSAPFHSPLMQPAAEKMREELSKISFGEMRYPVISNVTAKPYQSSGEILENLVDQIVKPVRWYETMGYLDQEVITKAIEIGPGVVLKNLIKRVTFDLEIHSFEKPKHLENIISNFTYKRDLTKVITKSLAIAVSTRNRNWDNDQYEKGVVQPYKMIQALQTKVEAEGREATIQEAKDVITLLKQILVTKQLSADERNERLTELLEVTGTLTEFRDLIK